MKIQITEHDFVVIGERMRFNYCGYPLKHVQTAIRRLHSGKPYYLASPIYNFSRPEVAALLINADKILNHKTRN